MSKFVFYESNTGRITKVMDCNDEDAPLNVEKGELSLKVSLDLGVCDSTHYIDPETRMVRDKEPLSGVKELILSPGELTTIPLPEVCSIAIEGDIYDVFEVDDNILELEFSTPGEYIVSFDMVHYIKKEVRIHVKED